MVEVRILFGAWLAVKTKSEVGESVGGIGGGRLSERLVALTLGGGGSRRLGTTREWFPPWLKAPPDPKTVPPLNPPP